MYLRRLLRPVVRLGRKNTVCAFVQLTGIFDMIHHVLYIVYRGTLCTDIDIRVQFIIEGLGLCVLYILGEFTSAIKRKELMLHMDKLHVELLILCFSPVM